MAQTKAERDANLDALKTAAADWASKESVRIEKETKFLRSVRLGIGADNAATLNLFTALPELGDEIDRFLLVG